MRKLILAPMALACLIGAAAAQQAPTTNVGNFPATQAVTQSGVWGFGLTGPIPAGSNVIGGVTQSGGPWSVSGTVSATQSGSWTVGLSAGASVLADLRVAGAAVSGGNPVPVSVGNFPSSQAVTNAGTFAVQNTAAMPAGANTIGSIANISGTISLPTGAATAAAQTTGNSSLATLAGAVSGGKIQANDVNNAPFATAAALTSGSAAAAGRSVGVVCTAAGNIVLTLSGGGTITLPVLPGWQTFPFAATQFTFSGGAAGSVYNLN